MMVAGWCRVCSVDDLHLAWTEVGDEFSVTLPDAD